ncbi:MAG: hypothetical protein OXF46_00725 [Rhodobacteraceae bacterium]|nr:hypothetical protein [Paracoccaceae bacterium]
MLSRLVEEGVVLRITGGLFVCPKKNPFVSYDMLGVAKIIEVMARENGETIQINSGEVTLIFRLSTNVLHIADLPH